MIRILLVFSILLVGCFRRSTPVHETSSGWNKVSQAGSDLSRAAPEVKVRKPATNGYGLSFGGSSGKAMLLGLLYRRNRVMYELGYTHQFNGQLGQLKGERLPNYGKYVTGRDTYYTAPIIGLSYWVSPRVAIGADFAFGFEKSFSNYSDKRFKAGGYHMIDGSAGINGYGGKLYYLVGNYFTVSGGYNTLYGGHVSLGFSNFTKE